MAKLSERELDLRAQANAIEKALSVPGTFEVLAEEVNRLCGAMIDIANTTRDIKTWVKAGDALKGSGHE